MVKEATRRLLGPVPDFFMAGDVCRRRGHAMLWARMLADAVVVMHAVWVAFVVFGMAAILAGLALGWGWVRNFWFRVVHLGMIGIVVAETLVGVACPLTRWEKQLRELGGQAAYSGDFIGYWTHRLIFFDAPPWVFTVAYLAFGAAVLAAFLLGPPRLPRRARALTHATPHEPVA